MSDRNIEDIIGALYDLVQDARSMPLAADKCILERDRILDMLDEIIASGEEKDGVTVIASAVNGMKGDEMRTLCDKIKDKLSCAAILLASAEDGKITFVGMATKDAVAKGIHIGNIIKTVTTLSGGGGGGKPDMAQGAGKDVSKLDEAVTAGKAAMLDMIK